jgi:hypothetical protein
VSAVDSPAKNPALGEDAGFIVTSFERRPKALTFPTTSTAAPFQRASIVCRQSKRDEHRLWARWRALQRRQADHRREGDLIAGHPKT